MTFKDICTRKTYQKDGAEKVTWLKCGTLRITDEGKQFIEFNHLPGITFFVFEPKQKDGAPAQKNFTNPKDPSEISWEE